MRAQLRAAGVALSQRDLEGSAEAGRRRDHWLAAGVGLAGALALALLSSVSRTEPTPRGDDLIYELIARHPFGVHTFPFGYRVGLPLGVNVLPLDSTTGFRLLAWIAAGGAGAFAYLLMREFCRHRALAASLALLMCISPPFLVVALRNGRNTDIATVFFMMAATYFVVKRRYVALAGTLLVGVVVREAVLFEVPLAYAVWSARLLDARAARRALAVGAPAAAAYVALRLGISTVGKAQVPGYGGSLVGGRLTLLRRGLESPWQEARRMFTVYGPYWLLAPLALKDLRFARCGLVLLALAVLSMTYATDWGRMILLAAPAFYPATAYVLDRHRGWWLPAVGAAFVLAVGYALYMDHSGLQHGIIENPEPRYPVR
ncbi:MAG: hypothetical protein QOI03_1835 [Solirubrobacteraceae bacterium]|jgi:hypothetical protein|nr:hypothetical protein [Solirubrobacteraceae bacterium]